MLAAVGPGRPRPRRSLAAASRRLDGGRWLRWLSARSGLGWPAPIECVWRCATAPPCKAAKVPAHNAEFRLSVRAFSRASLLHARVRSTDAVAEPSAMSPRPRALSPACCCLRTASGLGGAARVASPRGGSSCILWLPTVAVSDAVGFTPSRSHVEARCLRAAASLAAIAYPHGSPRSMRAAESPRYLAPPMGSQTV